MRRLSAILAGVRSAAAFSFVLCSLIVATAVSGQQLIPFGDVPATADFTEQDIAARGQQQARDLTYSDWKKVCFKGVQGADAKIICRTSINGKWDTGQIVLKIDLIEREEAPVARLQIFVLPGFFLQPGVKLVIDKDISTHVPYTICLVNGCVAATVADPAFINAMESARTLSLDAVNTNVVTVVATLPLDNFAKAHQGPPEQVFEQRLEGKWEQPTDKGSAN